MIATGVRWEESYKRKERGMFETISRDKSNKAILPDEKMLLTDNGDARRLFER